MMVRKRNYEDILQKEIDLYIYIYIYIKISTKEYKTRHDWVGKVIIFTNRSARAGYDTRSIF